MADPTASDEPRPLPAGEQRSPPRWAPWTLWLVGCLALVAWRRETLALPPYEDQAVGLWTEADFLAESNFDYYALRYQQSHFMSPQSGVRSYMISVLPTVVAVLMRAAPSPRASFIAAHLLTAAAASGCCVLVWRLSRTWLGDAAAVALGAVLATTPLFAVQAEMLGMDVPLTLLTLWSLALVHRGRWLAAAGAGFGAFMMKATGALVTGGMVACLLAWWWSSRGMQAPLDRRLWRRALMLNLALLLVEWSLIAWGDTSREVRMQIEWPACLRLPSAWNWCPDVLLALLISAGATALRLAWKWRLVATPVKDDKCTRIARWIHHELDERPSQVLAWCVLAGLVVACSRYIFIPRYFTCGAALTLVTLAGVSPVLSVGLRRCTWAALLTWVGFNVANADGRWYPDIETAAGDDFLHNARLHARSCPFTERSREYLVDQRANLSLMNWLERAHGDEPALLPLPYLYYATKPRLGYVSRPLAALDAGNFATALQSFTEHSTPLADGGWQSPLLVWTGASRVTLPPPRTAAELLYNDGLRPPVKVYRARVPDAIADRQQLADWYVAQTRSADFLAIHSRVGRDNLGTWAMTLMPELFAQQRYLAESLIMAELNLLADDDSLAHVDLALYPELQDGSRQQQALRALAEAIRRRGFATDGDTAGLLRQNLSQQSSAAGAAPLYAAAWREAARGDVAAARKLTTRLEQTGQFPLDALLLMTKLHWHEGSWTAAERHAQTALATETGSAAARYWLGLLAGRRGDRDRAREHFLALVRTLPQLVGAEELAKRVPRDD